MSFSALTGVNSGEFTSLRVLDSNGLMQDINTIVSQGGGGGGSGVGTAQPPLSITNGVISLGPFPSAGINVEDGAGGTKTITVSQFGGLFVNGVEYVQLFYLQNTWSPPSLTFTNANGQTVVLACDTSGNITADGALLLTQSALNTWAPTQRLYSDGAGNPHTVCSPAPFKWLPLDDVRCVRESGSDQLHSATMIFAKDF